MTPSEFEQKLASIQEQAPDEIDLAMLSDAELSNDGSTVSLESFQKNLEDYSGKLNIRIPRSLHRKLSREAKADGVSLNQYILYKLAQ